MYKMIKTEEFSSLFYALAIHFSKPQRIQVLNYFEYF